MTSPLPPGSTLLVTGGAGFIGSNFVRHLVRERPGVRIRVLDALTYAGNLENLGDLVSQGDVTFIKGDVAHPGDVETALGGGVEAIVNIAAETHVDRSIQDASAFLRTNVQGVQTLIETLMKGRARRLVQVSTDEVYGSIEPPGSATETNLLRPSNPYSASKAGADLLLGSYHHTHGLDVVITRCTNNYGPWQFPEKLIPLMITNALEDRSLPVYGDGGNIRDWIHVDDHCAGILAALERGRAGEVYNFGGGCEWTNLDLVHRLLEILARPRSLIRFVTDRLGHDRRYSLDASKARRELDFEPARRFEEGLESTVSWYRAHETWWRRIRTGEYLTYYERMYGTGDAVHRPTTPADPAP